VIELRFATLDFTPQGAVTAFADGSSYGAIPHDEPHYHAIAHRLGYEGDILKYAQEHELAHHLIAESFGSHSPVLWALAHGEEPPAMLAAAEEALALALQRYARTNEHPMIDRMDWAGLRRRFLELAPCETVDPAPLQMKDDA
jgi:hypothetical protein